MKHLHPAQIPVLLISALYQVQVTGISAGSSSQAATFKAGFGESIGGFLAIAILLAVGTMIYNAIISGFNGVASVLSGRNVSVIPKDGGSDDPARAITSETPPKREDFRELRDDQCPLHGREYIGWTLFYLIEPAGLKMNVSGPAKDRVVTALYLIGCEACFTEACKHKEFRWYHHNSADHPVWGARQLSPGIVGDRFYQIGHHFRLFDTPAARVCVDSWLDANERRKTLDVINALGMSEQDIQLLKGFLTHPDFDVVKPLLGSPKRHYPIRLAAHVRLTLWGIKHATPIIDENHP